MKARVLVGFVLWLVAVAVVAVIAWVAINTAGRQVTTATPVSAPLPTDAPGLATETITSPPGTTTPPATRRPSGSAARPTSAAASPSASAQTRSPAPTRSSDKPVTSTYSTPAGRVKVTCTGPVASLDGGYAQPESGWSVRVDSSDPQHLMIDYRRSWSQPVQVVVTCDQGRPAFSQPRGTDPTAPTPPSGPGPGPFDDFLGWSPGGRSAG